MADLWIPGWSRYQFGLRGKSYQYTHNPKGCLHTTEGGSIGGALSAYEPYPPHGIYDWRTRERLQHIPLNLASYSAMDGNDDDYMVQIELVGFAAESRHWPEWAWSNIAEDVVKPLEDLFGIPRDVVWHGFKDGLDGITLAVEGSPIRLTPGQLRDFSGWLGHQHLPAPDTHWDPGVIRMDRIFSYLSEDMMDAGQEAKLDQVLALAQETRNRTASMHTKGYLEVGSNEARAGGGDLGWFQTQSRAALAPVLDALKAISERVAKLEASGVPVTVDYAAMAKANADEADRRSRDGDPKTGPVS